MPDSLTIHLENTSDDEVYAYVTGFEIDNDNQLVMVKVDGRSLYRPATLPSGDWLQSLEADIAIPLGRARNSAGRYANYAGITSFSRGPKKLTFLLNPLFDQPGGGCSVALVEPSILNPADPNIGIDYSFCEFTFDKEQLYANISYVDFVPRLPISLTLKGADNAKDIQHVSGMKAEAFDSICEELREQTKRDGYPWSSLVVCEPSSDNDADPPVPIRILSPMHGKSVGASFDGYFETYVDEVWNYYREDNNGKEYGGTCGNELVLNSQTSTGILRGTVDRHSDLFTFYPRNKACCVGGPDKCLPTDPEIEVFYKPSTIDILSCTSGPFQTRNRPLHNAIVPRLAAAFQRSTLLYSSLQPAVDTTIFYTNEITNHYARIVHAANLDGRGYAFAYDDVQSTFGYDQSGKVNMAKPGFFKVAVGGKSTYIDSSSCTLQDTADMKAACRSKTAKAPGNVRFPMYSTTTKYRSKDSGSGSGSASGAGSNEGGASEGSVHSAVRFAGDGPASEELLEENVQPDDGSETDCNSTVVMTEACAQPEADKDEDRDSGYEDDGGVADTTLGIGEHIPSHQPTDTEVRDWDNMWTAIASDVPDSVVGPIVWQATAPRSDPGSAHGSHHSPRHLDANFRSANGLGQGSDGDNGDNGDNGDSGYRSDSGDNGGNEDQLSNHDIVYVVEGMEHESLGRCQGCISFFRSWKK